jgi:hypothetical protein
MRPWESRDKRNKLISICFVVRNEKATIAERK